MAKIRNRSGMDLEVPGRGLVVADGVLEVADEDVYGFTVSTNWDAVDKDATSAHTKGERAEQRAVKAEAKVVEEATVPVEPAPADA